MKLLLEVSARVLALLWAGFWIFFFIAESIETHSHLPIAMAWIALGLFFLLLALAPWRWEKPGAFLLIVVGIVLGPAYAIWAPTLVSAGVRALAAVGFAVPPLTAGVLFLLHSRPAVHHA